MLKKQINSNKKTQDTKYPDAKPAQRAEHYEDFTVLAERLRKEGRLDEESYKNLRKEWIKSLLTITLICGLPMILSFGHKGGFVFFLLGFFGIFSIISGRKNVNRICYLSNFGFSAEGTVVETIKKDQPYPHHSSFSYIFDRDAFFVHKVIYQFYDSKNKLHTIIETYDFPISFSITKRKLRKIYNIGDTIKIYYDPNNSNDCMIDYFGLSNKDQFKLILTSNK